MAPPPQRPFGSFGETGEGALQIAVASFRRRISVRSGNHQRVTVCPSLVPTVLRGNAVPDALRPSRLRRGNDAERRRRHSHAEHGNERGLASFHRRISVRSGKLARARYRLPWLRFVDAFRFVRGRRERVTDCRGFVSRGVDASFLTGMRTNLGCHGFSEPVPDGPS
jgi:hypothetical protein